MSQVVIQALPSNSGNIYIGDEDVSALEGAVLAPGTSLAIQADVYEGDTDYSVLDLARTYVDSDNNGDGVSITYLDELEKNLNL